MPVYLPTAAVGNGRVLTTLGGAGEIMTFFYPRLDFAQNVEECLPLLYIGHPGHGQMRWTFDDAFSRRQAYEPDTNIVVTALTLAEPALTLTFTDFCPPTAPALIRRIRLENRHHQPFAGSFGHYFDLRLGEVYGKQAVGYAPEGGYFLQYFRGTAVAVGGSRPAVWRCGKSLAYDDRSAKKDLEDGHLNGQLEDIGRVNFAGLQHLYIKPGESWEGWLVLAAGPSRDEAIELLQELQAAGAAALQDETRTYWHNWLSQRRKVCVPPEVDEAYRRSLLALALLQDASTGSFIAAPEFDPAYERCGGYGYCWPRDASESAGALAQGGYPEAHSRLCDWYRRAQLPGGLWAQRHWGDGQVAASWALRPGFEQLDQTAAALCSLCEEVLQAPADQQPRLLEQSWEVISKAARGLQKQIGDDGLHHYACDLWETYCGVFLYTNAALARALGLAAQCAELAGQSDWQQVWQQIAETMNSATLAEFNGHYFPRGYRSDGEPDQVMDSSTLGLVEPWALLSPADPHHRKMILSNLHEIEHRLGEPLPGGLGIRRFEGDAYLGGVVGCVNTLWTAQVYLQLAVAQKAASPAEAQSWRDQALSYIRLALSRATVTGLLPELIGLQPDTPYWAAPHGWASGLLVRCAVLLDQYETA